MSIDDLVASGEVQEHWVTRQTDWDVTWEVAWASQDGAAPGHGGPGDIEGGPAPEGEAQVLVVVTFLRDASEMVMQLMAGELMRAGFRVDEEDLSWSQQVVTVRVSDEAAHVVAERLGKRFFDGLGPHMIPHSSTRVMPRPGRAGAGHACGPLKRTAPELGEPEEQRTDSWRHMSLRLNSEQPPTAAEEGPVISVFIQAFHDGFLWGWGEADDGGGT